MFRRELLPLAILHASKKTAERDQVQLRCELLGPRRAEYHRIPKKYRPGLQKKFDVAAVGIAALGAHAPPYLWNHFA